MRYLIPEFTGMGDFIQKTPMMRTIRELDDDAFICLVGDNRWNGLDLVKESPFVDEICNVSDMLGLEFPESYNNLDIAKLYEGITGTQRKSLSSWLRKIEWDIFLDSFDSDIPPNVRKLAEQSRRGTIYRHTDIDGLYPQNFLDRLRNRRNTAGIKLVPVLKGRHLIDENYDLFEACFGHPLERSYDTWISVKPKRRTLEKWRLSTAKYICLQPGAANGGPTPKRWHPDNFVDLSRELIERSGLEIVLVGDQGDRDHITSKRKWPEEVIDTAGLTSIEDLCSLIENAACVVAHDSGIMHIANAMKTSLVALYGPTDFTVTRPLGETSKVLYSRTPAFAIMYESKMSEEKLAEKYPDHQAMSGITVDEVVEAVIEISERTIIPE